MLQASRARTRMASRRRRSGSLLGSTQGRAWQVSSPLLSGLCSIHLPEHIPLHVGIDMQQTSDQVHTQEGLSSATLLMACV